MVGLRGNSHPINPWVSHLIFTFKFKRLSP
jgi:hypothetical protein